MMNWDVLVISYRNKYIWLDTEFAVWPRLGIIWVVKSINVNWEDGGNFVSKLRQIASAVAQLFHTPLYQTVNWGYKSSWC
jgi:hypothetical protein